MRASVVAEMEESGRARLRESSGDPKRISSAIEIVEAPCAIPVTVSGDSRRAWLLGGKNEPKCKKSKVDSRAPTLAPVAAETGDPSRA